MRVISLEKIIEFDGTTVEVEVDGADEYAIFRVVLEHGKFVPDLDNYPWCASKNFVSKKHLMRVLLPNLAWSQEKIREVYN